jgi:hypothetical protein
VSDERITIVDVANRAGAAISSVSSALNGRPGVSEVARMGRARGRGPAGRVPCLEGAGKVPAQPSRPPAETAPTSPHDGPDRGNSRQRHAVSLTF